MAGQLRALMTRENGEQKTVVSQCLRGGQGRQRGSQSRTGAYGFLSLSVISLGDACMIAYEHAEVYQSPSHRPSERVCLSVI